MTTQYELEVLFGQGEAEEPGEIVPLPSMPLLAEPPGPDDPSVANAVEEGRIQQQATGEVPDEEPELDDIRIGDEIELPDGGTGIVSWIDPKRKRIAVGKGKNKLFISVTETEKVNGRQVAQDIRSSRQEANRSEGRDVRPEPVRLPDTIELPPGLNLMPHQLENVEFLATRGRGLIADEMGLGKTISALVSIQAPAVVVCPSLLKVNWVRELNKWKPDLTVVMLDGTKKLTVTRGVEGALEQVDAKTAIDADVVVVNYDILYAHVELLASRRNTTVIADEAHYLKNMDIRWNKSQRKHEVKGGPRWGKAFCEVQRTADRLILLTGTPILNRPKEIFPLLHMLDPQEWGSGFNFCMRYCAGRYEFLGRRQVFKCDGRSNSQELHERIDGVYMMRHTKEAELVNLPAKRRGSKTVSLSPHYARMYRKARNEFLEWLAETAGEEAVGRALQAEALVKLNKLRGIAAAGKADATVAEIVDFFQSTQRPLVVMGSHHDAFRLIAEGLNKVNEKYADQVAKGKTPDLPRPIRYGRIVGGMGAGARQAAIDAFQVEGSIDVMLYSIAIATGTTLTRASDMIFFERLWRPADQLQAEDRIHRIGQEQKVSITYLDAEGTIDLKLAQLLMEKSKSAAAIIDGQDLDETEAAAAVLGDMIGGSGSLSSLRDLVENPRRSLFEDAALDSVGPAPSIFDGDERFDAYVYDEEVRMNPSLYDRLAEEGIVADSWGDPL